MPSLNQRSQGVKIQSPKQNKFSEGSSPKVPSELSAKSHKTQEKKPLEPVGFPCSRHLLVRYPKDFTQRDMEAFMVDTYCHWIHLAERNSVLEMDRLMGLPELTVAPLIALLAANS